jgi:transcriptional regulator with XRE-family HTH domain
MLIDIRSVTELGLAIRAARKAGGVRLDDLAGTAGVGHVFVRETERGKETVQLGRVLRLLNELGIELKADVPESALPMLERLRSEGLKPLPLRRKAGRP